MIFVLLTARSPRLRTRQWSRADCPTVAVISRFVELSKYGGEYGVSQYDADDADACAADSDVDGSPVST